MKRCLLSFMVHIPLTYDETKMSMEQALDAAQRVAEKAISRAIEGRNFTPDGEYLDYHGPSAVPDPTPG